MTTTPIVNERSTTTTASRPGTALRSPVALPALIGVAFLAFEGYLFSRWIGSGSAEQNDYARSQAPTWMSVVMWAHVVLAVIAVAWVINHFLVQPWRRHGRPNSDALLVLAIPFCFWQDLLSNYFHYHVVYPTVWPNLGSWYNFVPGWHGSAGNLQAEATIFFLPAYVIVMFGFTSFALVAMRAAKRRWTTIGPVRLFLIAWLVLGGIDLVLEIFWVKLGLFIYPATISWLTVNGGHYYQFPVYESMCWGASWAFLASLRHHVDDRGLTVFERGAARIRGERRQLVVRFLAMVAAVNIGLLTYNVEFAAIGSQTGHWVRDVIDRPYMTDGLCEAGAAEACPQAGR
jgi:hypothetical protein